MRSGGSKLHYTVIRSSVSFYRSQWRVHSGASSERSSEGGVRESYCLALVVAVVVTIIELKCSLFLC